MISRIGVVAVIALAALSGASEARDRSDGDGENDDQFLGDDFVFDVVARANEAVVGNIDSIDLALLGVLAALAAVVVFGIDKIDVATVDGKASYALLGSSALACIVGYVFGLWTARDSIDPQAFFINFALQPQKITALATRGTVEAYGRNIRDRRAKRAAVGIALLLLTAGTVMTAVARQHQPVVHSTDETSGGVGRR